MTDLRVAYANLGQLQRWDARKARALALLRDKARASIYLLTECEATQAAYLAAGLGWDADPGRPCWTTDANRNTVLWDPAKWWDRVTLQVSLALVEGDLADRHFRSVNWCQLQQRGGTAKGWFGAAHLSNGPASSVGDARTNQTRRLVAELPGGAPRLLGIDRNSLPSSAPAKTLTIAGLRLLTPHLSDSFIGNGKQPDTRAIDGFHGDVRIRSVAQVDSPAALDHSLIVAGVTLTRP